MNRPIAYEAFGACTAVVVRALDHKTLARIAQQLRDVRRYVRARDYFAAGATLAYARELTGYLQTQGAQTRSYAACDRVAMAALRRQRVWLMQCGALHE